MINNNLVTTVCGCDLEMGTWIKATCEHGRDWIIGADGLAEIPISPPTRVCLCGSTRFSEAFRAANLEETLKGHIIPTIGCDTKGDDDLFGSMPAPELAALKEQLDVLHFRKIDLADEVLILNVGGYIGESTARELAYALAIGKKVRFLEGDDENQWARYHEGKW